ncbi:MAG TPA: pyridoxal-dependent decarboxylase, exosortase A system-associated [Halothiobacillaceae bacterium]|mgnify:CR=1 FL=1|nr:pyridoxal-dependent decarboxylase, exosortase A system-associated [Halothiobacillaceae bacterium]
MASGYQIAQQHLGATAAYLWRKKGLDISRHDTTPTYCYHAAVIDHQIQALRGVLPKQIALHYAIKANPNPSLLAHMAPQVDGFDCASLAEMQLAINASGGRNAHISLAGPAKSTDELAFAVKHRIIINCESASELNRIADLAKTQQTNAKVALRINPPFAFKGAGMQMGGGPKPFGIDSEQIPELIAQWQADAHIQLVGFHLFAGSQQLNPELIGQMWLASLNLIADWQAETGFSPEQIVLGAGLGVAYHEPDTPLDLNDLKPALREMAICQQQLGNPYLALESGRFLVAPAGVYFTRIVDIKFSRGETFLLCDGGMHQHLALSGNLGGVIRRNWPLVVPELLDQPHDTAVQIHGPLCTPLDVLGQNQPMPANVEPGMHIAVLQSGAYGASASPSGFLSRPALQERLI